MFTKHVGNKKHAIIHCCNQRNLNTQPHNGKSYFDFKPIAVSQINAEYKFLRERMYVCTYVILSDLAAIVRIFLIFGNAALSGVLRSKSGFIVN